MIVRRANEEGSGRTLGVGQEVLLPIRFQASDRWVPCGYPFSDAIVFYYTIRWTPWQEDDTGTAAGPECRIDTLIALPADTDAQILGAVRRNEKVQFRGKIESQLLVLDMDNGAWVPHQEFTRRYAPPTRS